MYAYKMLHKGKPDLFLSSKDRDSLKASRIKGFEVL